MKKKICIALAALLMTTCFVGCGEKGSESEAPSSSSSEASESSAASEESSDAEKAEKDEDKDGEDSSESDKDKDSDEDESSEDSEKKAEPVEIKPDDVKEEDFVGKWECAKMVSGGETVEGSVMGLPLNVMLRFEIKEDGTGEMGSGMPTDSEEEAATMKQEIKWTYADNKLTVTVDGEEDEAYMYIEGGKAVFTDDEQLEVYYFDKVDEFTEYSMEDMYKALGVDPSKLEEDIDASLDESSSESKDVETSSAAD